MVGKKKIAKLKKKMYGKGAQKKVYKKTNKIKL